MYTAERLFDGKCNMMLSCDKSLCNVLNYWTTFMMHKNAQANFTRACLNVTRHWWDSKSNPPPCKSSRSILVIVVLQHLFKRASIPPQLVCLHGFYMDGIAHGWLVEQANASTKSQHQASKLSLVFNFLLANSM
jgi:hypothetical protein